MPCDYETAQRETFAVVKAAFDASTYPAILIHWPNVKNDVPTARVTPTNDPTPWARVTWKHSGAKQRGFTAAGGVHKFENTGLLSVELYLPGGRGLAANARLVTVVADAFRGKCTPSGVWFPDVEPRDVGNDGPWFRTDVLVEFRYDEIK